MLVWSTHFQSLNYELFFLERLLIQVHLAEIVPSPRF